MAIQVNKGESAKKFDKPVAIPTAAKEIDCNSSGPLIS